MSESRLEDAQEGVSNPANEQHERPTRCSASRAAPQNRCTGCNVEFDEDYLCDGECETCGYVACESCICDPNNGESVDETELVVN